MVTILDLMLLRFLIFLHRFRGAMSPRIDRWIQDGVFQLQRRAYEARGEGIWKNRQEEIPVTWSKEELCELPLDSESDNTALYRRKQICGCSGGKVHTLRSSATDATAVAEESNQRNSDEKNHIELEKLDRV